MPNSNPLKWSDKKTFLLCMGAQKAGTTWLCRTLLKSPMFWDADLKEWRIWKFYFDELAKYNAIQRYAKDAVIGTNEESKLKFKKRLELLASTEALENLIIEAFVEKKVKVLGDFTPSNGFIPKSNIQSLINIFKNYGIKIKAILILRDPVERIISQARMESNGKYSNFIKTQKDFNNLLLNKKWLSGALEKTDYKNPLLTAKNSFDKNKAKVVFFEELFSQEMINEICEFLDIPKIEMIPHIINEGKTNFKAPIWIKRKIYNNLKDTYRSVENFYPKEMELFWEKKLHTYKNH